MSPCSKALWFRSHQCGNVRTMQFMRNRHGGVVPPSLKGRPAGAGGLPKERANGVTSTDTQGRGAFGPILRRWQVPCPARRGGYVSCNRASLSSRLSDRSRMIGMREGRPIVGSALAETPALRSNIGTSLFSCLSETRPSPF